MMGLAAAACSGGAGGDAEATRPAAIAAAPRAGGIGATGGMVPRVTGVGHPPAVADHVPVTTDRRAART
jgi:hypothetical protein